MQKKRPPAEPIYLEPTSGVSMRIRVRRGTSVQEVTPYRINPATIQNPVKVKNAQTDIVTVRAITAMAAPRLPGGIILGRSPVRSRVVFLRKSRGH